MNRFLSFPNRRTRSFSEAISANLSSPSYDLVLAEPESPASCRSVAVICDATKMGGTGLEPVTSSL